MPNAGRRLEALENPGQVQFLENVAFAGNWQNPQLMQAVDRGIAGFRHPLPQGSPERLPNWAPSGAGKCLSLLIDSWDAWAFAAVCLREYTIGMTGSKQASRGFSPYISVHPG